MWRISLLTMMLVCFVLAPLLDSVRAQPSTANPKPQRVVAITIDDLPVASSRRDLKTWNDITDKLLRHIRADRVPAIGFVNENKLLDDNQRNEARVAVLRKWVEAGLELGNHTYSHPSLNRTPLAEFQETVMRGEEVTKALLATKGKSLHYFRHPFLHTGRELAIKHQFEAFLKGRGYTIAPVTIDNSDWIFARAYDKAIVSNDQAMLKQIGAAYVPYMEAVTEYYEKQSVALFGYEMKQILLIHANSINADYLDDLFRMYKKRGYQFITLEEALTDKAHQSPDTFTGAAGISWLHRWAITRGVERSFFTGEPVVPEMVMKYSGETSQ